MVIAGCFVIILTGLIRTYPAVKPLPELGAPFSGSLVPTPLSNVQELAAESKIYPVQVGTEPSYHILEINCLNIFKLIVFFKIYRTQNNKQIR